MKLSQLFSKTKKEVSKDETSINAQLLIKAGFINKLSAGIYSYLPLGWRVLNKIENIIREEIDAIGGQEVLMPALHPKENWQKTGRWNSMDCLFKIKADNKEFALGPTHEEIVYPLLSQYINSYKDLPAAVYQIQTKFRHEARAKSGLLRGREFRMKDLYSFHIDEKDRDIYYNLVKKTYARLFKRIGLDAIEVIASGGTFSDLSLEYQVVTAYGEDIIYICPKCKAAYNREIITNDFRCPRCKIKMEEKKAIEVGNIFPLREKFAQDFNLHFIEKNGNKKLVSAGCYGIGTSRIMGAMVETSHDEKGIIWPREIAPYLVELVELNNQNKDVRSESIKLYNSLSESGVEVLYDERENVSIGEKFADADLIGCPWQIIISAKTLTQNSVEIKERKSGKSQLIKMNQVIKNLAK